MCNWCPEVQHLTANSDNKVAHLRGKHGITKDGRKEPWKHVTKEEAAGNVKRVSLRGEKEGVSNLVQVVQLNPFKSALIAWIVICQLSLSLAVNDLFVEFLKTIYPSIDKILPSATKTIRRWIMEAYEARKVIMKEDLHRAISNIHFSFDLWTSPNHLALIGVVAHYVNESGKNQSVIITPPLPRTCSHPLLRN